MTEREAIDKINNRICYRPDNWKYRSDSKLFGWGRAFKKNRLSKKGYKNWSKEERKRARKYEKFVKHCKLFHIPLPNEYTFEQWKLEDCRNGNGADLKSDAT